MWGSLDFVYVPTADVDAAVRHYVDALGSHLLWKVRAMNTTVACLHVSDHGPVILLSGACPGQGGQRYAVYQLLRPEAAHVFDGRIDT